MGYRDLAADIVLSALEDYATRQPIDERYWTARAFFRTVFGEGVMAALDLDPDVVWTIAKQHRETYFNCLKTGDIGRLAAWRQRYFASSIRLGNIVSRMRRGEAIDATDD
jgi:hypothetical protein